MTRRAAPSGRRQGGAALLIAMLILTLVATVASAMVWHQQRAIEVETAERARAQAGLMLAGALDFVRQQLAGQTRGAFPPQGWLGKLPESSLAALLAADRDNNADSTVDAYLSGEIVDAQSRYNLRRLFGDDGKPVIAEVQALGRLCDAAGVSADVLDRLLSGLTSAWITRGENAVLAPTRLENLSWLGIDGDTLTRLKPFVDILPVRTAVNANTAEPPVLMAAIDGLTLADAQRLSVSLKREPAANMGRVRSQLPPGLATDDARVNVQTRFFDVTARLRADDRVLEERWLIERRQSERGVDMVLLRRDRRSLNEVGT